MPSGSPIVLTSCKPKCATDQTTSNPSVARLPSRSARSPASSASISPSQPACSVSRMFVQKTVDIIDRCSERFAAADPVLPSFGIAPGRPGRLDDLWVTERREKGLLLSLSDIKQCGKIVAMMCGLHAVVLMPDTPHRWRDADFAEALGIPDGQVLGERDLRTPAMVSIHPKASSMRLRIRWLVA